jgi:ammonia channel protein AmtB
MSEKYFDTNGIFVVHGVAGWAGMLLTAAFARHEPFFPLVTYVSMHLTDRRADIAALDGYTVIINHKWEQLGFITLPVPNSCNHD